MTEDEIFAGILRYFMENNGYTLKDHSLELHGKVIRLNQEQVDALVRWAEARMEAEG